MARSIFITEADRQKLQKVINLRREFYSENTTGIKALEDELARACILPANEIPEDVITMHSKVVLKELETGEEMTYTLVYPDDADLAAEKISVLAPVGTAILGYRAGDVVDWPVPNGVVRLRVERVLYQPEATGDFEL